MAARNALASIDAIEIAEKLNDEEISPNDYFKLRSAVVAELKSSPKTHPYPHKFHVSMSLEAFIEKYSSLEDGEQLDGVKLTLAGRVHSIRESGAKLIFYDLHGEGVKLQVMANAKAYETMDGFYEVTDTIRRGDVIGITGSPLRSRKGELSILPTKVSWFLCSTFLTQYLRRFVFLYQITLLAPCLHMLPDPHVGLKNKETRFRQRYLDLLVNSEVILCSLIHFYSIQ